MEKREQPCAAPAAPANISATLDGYRWARDTVGESGGAVYRLHGKAGAPDLYLKCGEGPIADEIANEMVRLRWLAGRLPAPSVEGFVQDRNAAWLLMSAMRGQAAWQLMDAQPALRPTVVDALAAFLRRLHAIPVDSCPFTSDHAHRLRAARVRIDAGLVDEDDFDEEREGWSAEQVWDAMQVLLPLDPDAVVTHGDYSLDNLFVLDGAVCGAIDAGRVGIADRYQDLAIMWNCLGEFGADCQQRFLASYGIDTVDQRKLAFHLMLDELF
ncbi:APH(3')-I family aminoglycoside O-phosphotransferase [uncultured Massilia sp.]|uniref:APH(3')-I family aminoglycoside O-phosphotransferase n=1 Tax=uncultured Massilia sp. TaxID=169973 RepID=UPI002584DA7D|nr:APH(3')-I family aminoglycoside O-phosphotransferase [uncultured Massilia sp.]